MDKRILLPFVALCFCGLIACADSVDVQLVKGGTLGSCPAVTVEELVDGFLGSPRWESGVAGDGMRFVNIHGGMTFANKPVDALIQFVVDPDAGQFKFNALEFNGVPQNNLTAAALLTKMCEGG